MEHSLNVRATLLYNNFPLSLKTGFSSSILFLVRLASYRLELYILLKQCHLRLELGIMQKMTLLLSLLPEIPSFGNYKRLQSLLNKNKSGLAHALNIAIVFSSYSHVSQATLEVTV